MKFTKSFIVAVGLLLPASFSALADAGFSSYATPGTAINVGTNYAIISNRSATGGEPLVTYLNVSSLAATAATLTQYISTNQTTLTATNYGTTTNVVVNTNGYAAGQWVVIQHPTLHQRFQTEAALISAVNSTNQIVLATTPINKCEIGDIINQETSWASIPLVSSATTPTSIVGTGILSGQRGEPMLLVATSTAASTNTINTANAVYQQ